MANATTGNPWIIDTAGSSALTNNRVKIAGIRWVGATAATHTAVITDNAGTVIWASEAAGSSYVEADSFNSNRMYTGLKVPTLASGKLYIEFG